MRQDQGLKVRHARRHEVALACEVEVAPAHCHLLRLTARAAAVRGRAEGTLVDVSSGGLGVIAPVFLPKQTLVHVRVRSPIDTAAEPLLEATLRVKRVVMTDRRPGYLLGLAYEADDETSRVQADRFLAMFEEDADA